jgi:Uri superfamily endonuclease
MAIDYLLNVPLVRIVQVKKFHAPECEINQKTKGTIFIKKFGTSDCNDEL